jgi:chemotaxis protein methyltransferase CheR
VLDRMARFVQPDGYLVLGAAETVVGLTESFKPLPERRGLYGTARSAAPPVKPLPRLAIAMAGR